VVKITSELRRSYFPTSYHNVRKRLFDDTKNKINVQIAKKTRMFIQKYKSTLAGNGWNLVNNHPLLNMMSVSPVGK
jgi:hypothetical protein